MGTPTPAISHVTKLYSVQDAKLFALLSDPDGGTPSYGPGIDAPGIQSMVIGGDIETKSLRGDNRALASNSSLTDITIDVSNAKLSLDALAVLIGGTTTDAGTAPSRTASWDLTADNAILPPFKIEGVTPPNGVDIIGADLHWVLYCCQLSKFPQLGFAQEDYQTASFSAQANPLISTGQWISAVLNETAVAIATAATGDGS